MLHVGAKPVDPLVIQIAPLNDHQSSSYVVYEDCNDGRKYMQGEFATTALHAVRSGTALTVTVDAAKGSYPGMVKHRALRVELPSDWPPQSVTVNRRAVSHVDSDSIPGWRYLGISLTTSILTDSVDVTQPITIKISRDPSWVEHAAVLEGFAGKMAALRRAYAQVNDLGLSDTLVAAMQTGDRMSYHPERARMEVEQLPELIASAQKKLEILAMDLKQADYHAHNNGTLDASAEEKRKQIIDHRIAIARAALASIAM
jgi:alpha-glucosidase